MDDRRGVAQRGNTSAITTKPRHLVPWCKVTLSGVHRLTPSETFCGLVVAGRLSTSRDRQRRCRGRRATTLNSRTLETNTDSTTSTSGACTLDTDPHVSTGSGRPHIGGRLVFPPKWPPRDDSGVYVGPERKRTRSHILLFFGDSQSGLTESWTLVPMSSRQDRVRPKITCTILWYKTTQKGYGGDSEDLLVGSRILQ